MFWRQLSVRSRRSCNRSCLMVRCLRTPCAKSLVQEDRVCKASNLSYPPAIPLANPPAILLRENVLALMWSLWIARPPRELVVSELLR